MNNTEQPSVGNGGVKIEGPIGANPEVRLANAQQKALQLFGAFEQKMKEAPTLETLVPFLIESEGVTALVKTYEQAAETAKSMQNPRVTPEQFEAFAKSIKEWSAKVEGLLLGGDLVDEPLILTSHLDSLRNIIQAIPAPDETIPAVLLPPKQTDADLSLRPDANAASNTQTGPAVPLAPKSVEVKKTLKAEKAEALADYFGEVESGTDFLAKIVNMRQSVALRKNLDLPKIEKLSSELSLKVMNFFDLVDTWEREKKGRKEIMESGEDFIASAKIPSGCQGAFRTIMLFAVRHKLGSAVETLKASPVGKPSETSAEAKTSPSLSSQDILAHYKAGKAAAQGAPEGAPTGEAPKPAPTPEGESESFLARIRDRGARLFYPTRKGTPEATPSAIPKPEITVPIPPTPPPVVESAPVSFEERIKALTFEEVLQFRPGGLQEVFRRTTMDTVSAALTDMAKEAPELVERVRSSLSEENRIRFDRLRGHLYSQAFVEASRKKIVEVAQGLLKEEKVSSAAPAAPAAPPEEPTAPTSRVESVISEEISEGWTPERIEALPFEGLADLSDDDLRLVVKSARTNAIGWGMLAQGLSENFRARIRKFVDYPPSFDDGTTIKTTPERINEGRKATVDFAKQKLLEALQRKHPPQS